MAEEIIGVKVKVDAGDMGKSVGSLKQQLREAQNEVNTLSEKFGATSKEAINAAKKAAELKDAIGDAKALTDAFNPDAKFKALTASLSGVAGGFAAVQGAIGLFGAESKEVEATLLKVQSAMALSQGLQTIGESIDSFKQLGAVIKSTTAFQKINNTVTALTASIMKGLGFATEATSVSFKVLKGAIAATGIGLLVVAVGELVNAFQNYQSSAEKAKKAQDDLNKSISEGAKVGLEAELQFAENQKQLDIAKAKNAGASEQQIFDIEQKYRKLKGNAQIRYWKEVKDADKEGAANALKEVEKINIEGSVAALDFQTKQREQAQENAKKAKEQAKQNAADAKAERERIQKEIEQETQARYQREDAARKVQTDAFRATLEERKQEELTIEDEYEERRSTLIRAGIYDFAAIEEQKRLALLAIADKYDKIDADKKKKEEEDQKQKDEEALKIAQTNRDRELEYATKIADTIEEKRVAELAALEEDYARKIALAQKNGEDTVYLEKLKAAAILDINKKAAEEEKKTKKAKFDSEVELASQTLSIIGGLVDQNSVAGKAIAVTQAIINTYQGASKAIAQGGILGPVAAAATIAAGLINVKKIVSTKIPSANGSGTVSGGGMPSMSLASAPIGPQQPQAQLTQLDQGTINRMGSAAGRAYVVESDITNQQEKIVRINRAARLA